MKTVLFAGVAIYAGMIMTKDDPLAAAKVMELMTKELTDLTAMLKTSQKDMETKYTELNNKFGGVELKALDDTLKAEVKQRTEDYTKMVTQVQSIEKAIDELKKEMDRPIHKGGKDLAEKDRENAVELQRRAFLFKGGDEAD